MQVTVESCTSININTLQKTIKRELNKDYPDSNQDEIYIYTLKELKKFSVEGQTFKYEAITNYLGGYRWFFLCPKCGVRATKLFLPPEDILTKENKYLCKKCHKLKNQSAIAGQNSIYKKVTRPLKRMRLIENKIGRGHLTSEKVQALLEEYNDIENKLKNSPEFRLYSFKKKHNI